MRQGRSLTGIAGNLPSSWLPEGAFAPSAAHPGLSSCTSCRKNYVRKERDHDAWNTQAARRGASRGLLGGGGRGGDDAAAHRGRRPRGRRRPCTRPPGGLGPGAGAGYWHTSGNQIFDSNGSPVRIAGINWYGFETPDEIAHGLWVQDYHTVINDIAALGYNTIRIPFSNQMVETPIVPQNLSFSNNTGGSINADLKGLNALQDLQKIVAAAGQAGLKVILDDHRSEAGESAEQNGLWYTSAYPSSAWVNDWATLAKMFAGNPTVIGFDLRNEPHTPTGDTYAQGATWGSGDTTTDVRLAYQQAGNAILAADPSALIFCEGISEFPDASASSGFDSTWWGGDLQGVAQFPVTLSSAGHVVYSAHDYGPNLFQQTWFNSSTTAASLDAVWNKYWGYIYAQGTAPVWVGRVRYRQRVVRRRVLHRRITRPVVPEPGVLHQRQQVDGLDLLGAQRRGLVRPAGQQLRRDAG